MKSRIIKQDRRRLERRKHVDPRYRNPNYPEFLDRRSGRDRRGQGADHQEAPIFPEHGTERRILLIVGTAFACVLTLFFFLFHYRIANY